jgi:uncharacterized protein (DUF427 family)
MVAHSAYMTPAGKRIQAVFGGEVIANSSNVMVMRETNHTPAYYFPMADVRMDLMTPTDNKST